MGTAWTRDATEFKKNIEISILIKVSVKGPI
jgi:hypothetical protein